MWFVGLFVLVVTRNCLECWFGVFILRLFCWLGCCLSIGFGSWLILLFGLLWLFDVICWGCLICWLGLVFW